MNSFWNLVGFEYKKIFKKKSVILLLMLSIAVTVFCTVAIFFGKIYADGGFYETSRDSIRKDRTYERALSGKAVDSELIMKAAQAYSKISDGDTNTANKQYEMYARPYSAMHILSSRVYSQSSGQFTIEDFKKLTKDEADNFYKIRRQHVVDSIEKSFMSKHSKNKLLALDTQIKTPFIFEYIYGYTHFDSGMYTIGLLICFVLAICLAPIFSGEYTSGTDQLILSSKHGKKQLIRAKLFTGISLSSLICLTLMSIIFVLSTQTLGTDGFNAPLQLLMPLCPYPLTMGQAALALAVCVLFASLLTACICMLLSSKLKSPFGVIIIITVIIVVPLFISINEFHVLSHNLFNLLPTKMVNFMNITSLIQYEIFGLVLPPYIFMPIFALLASALLMPFAYRGFKNHQIG